ncbi:MAG: hypothetical protein IKG27_04645 [Bacilli bacterium]|nr:hypothetical protein [Bacilli bacterium]
MRESIGSVFLYSVVFVFIMIVFGLLSATMSYYKGFKVNTRILSSINKFSGYNKLSKEEIEKYLSSIGYTPNDEKATCTEDTKKGELLSATDETGAPSNYLYCVYYIENDSVENDGTKKYYSYGVKSYIYIDLPIVGKIKVAIYSKGERIYKFDEKKG